MKIILFALFGLIIFADARAQELKDADKIMITVFLKHDQDMNITEIQQQLQENGFWRVFPPDEVEVVSWYIMMGVGHVVTVKLAPSKLRELNLAIESTAWGAFNTEFYVTYDYVPIWKEMKDKYR